jgi:hypothetical protein
MNSMSLEAVLLWFICICLLYGNNMLAMPGDCRLSRQV